MRKGIVISIELAILVFIFFAYKRDTTNHSLKENSETPGRLNTVLFEFEEITGIGYEKGVSRRDPSDIIKVDSQYYIWYTRIPAVTNGERTHLYNSGYYGTIWYATSMDGISWVEQGEALAPGEPGSFDSHAVFTPNILAYDDKYYLYYTGVKPTPGNPEIEFENNSETDVTAIGVSVASSPQGPFKRIKNEPILKISDEESNFDSYRIDDAAILIKNTEIWLYYKGRSKIHGGSGPTKTQMGVAFSDKPDGPFKKYKKPLLDKSHEVLIWNQDGGVASLTSINKSINLAQDGLNFEVIEENLANVPSAPGLYRPHLSDHLTKCIPGWGISHKVKDGDVYLTKFKFLSSKAVSTCPN